MKHFFFVTTLAGLLFFSACDMHTSSNGAIDGYWQLATVDTLGGGSADVREHKLFWAFQGDLLEMHHLEGQITDPRHPTLHWRFSLGPSDLTISAPTAYDRSATDSVVTRLKTVAPYGVSSLSETFKVQKLDKNVMTLESQALRLHFNKY